MNTAPVSPPGEGGDLAGLRALITGGTRGIGAATVTRFLAGGARVVTVARREADVPPGVHLVTADLAAPAGASLVAEEALDVLGGIDVLVNNRMAGPTSSTETMYAAPRVAVPLIAVG